jgi:hypothetical protein
MMRGEARYASRELQEVHDGEREDYYNAMSNWNETNMRYLPIVQYINPALSKMRAIALLLYNPSTRLNNKERRCKVSILHDLLYQYSSAISAYIINEIVPIQDWSDPLDDFQLENGCRLFKDKDGNFDIEVIEDPEPPTEGENS